MRAPSERETKDAEIAALKVAFKSAVARIVRKALSRAEGVGK